MPASADSSGRPLVVVTGPGHLLDASVAELQVQGWSITCGWDVSNVPSQGIKARIACIGRISTRRDAEAALLAALRWAAVISQVGNGDGWAAQFVEDLRRLGPVDIRSAESESPATRLNEEQLALLRLLSHGFCASRAARHLHISPRTAQRRLAAARTVLGVRSTAQAAAEARRLGLC